MWYRKTALVDAEQFITWDKDITNITIHSVTYPVYDDEKGKHIIIPSLEGNHRCNDLDWVLKGVKGEYWCVRCDIFESTYEIVDKPPTIA